jgi:hypothetical protein
MFHRYVREVDSSGHITLQNIHFNKTRALIMGKKEGRLTRQAESGRHAG